MDQTPLDEIFANRPDNQPVEGREEQQQRTEDRSTDHHSANQPREGGRFARKEQASADQQPLNNGVQPSQQDQSGQQTAPAAPQQQAPEGYVPQQALHAAREEGRTLKDRLAQVEALNTAYERQIEMMQRFQTQQQPQQQPQAQPDFYDDPSRFVQQTVQPIQQRVDGRMESFSRMLAEDKYGAETVNTAFAELKRRVNADPAGTKFDYDRIMASPHPFGELVKWHQQQARIAIPDDEFTAFQQWKQQQALGQQQPGQGHPQPPSPQNQQQPMPSNFTQARNNGPRQAPQWSGPQALSDIMGR